MVGLTGVRTMKPERLRYYVERMDDQTDYDAAMAILEQALIEEANDKAAEEPPQPILPPTPDQVCMAILQGMFASGSFGDDLRAPVVSAWAATAHYYGARLTDWPRFAQMAGFVPQGATPTEDI
jgi:hypothetical protein